MKILLIEDHPGLAEMSCQLLRSAYGYEVLHAATGGEGLKVAPAFFPDVVIIDLNLPDTNGYEVAKNLRADDRFAQTVLIALTGFGNVVDAERARTVGINAHFRKPMDFDLIATLKRVNRA